MENEKETLEEVKNESLLKKDVGQVSSSEDKREDTRSSIAMFYVIGFLVIVVLVLGISTYKSFDLSGFKDLLLAVSGILSGPLGFIIGYDFKSHKE